MSARVDPTRDVRRLVVRVKVAVDRYECSACRVEVGWDDRYCRRCGAPLEGTLTPTARGDA